MKFFQYDNPKIIIRGSFDNADFWNIVEKIFEPKGYRLIQSYNSPIVGLAGCEYQSKLGNHFTFEYDDWGNLDLYPDEPTNDDLLDELHLLANEIELIGSTNSDPFYYNSHVSRMNYPERPRIVT